MITGIVMASGFSRRMGQEKLLMSLDGTCLLEKVLLAGQQSKLDRIILVYRQQEVAEIGKKLGIETIYNDRANLGQSESMKKGIRASNLDSNYMFLVGDQPFLDHRLIDSLLEEFELEGKITVPTYAGRRGMPTVFPNSYRDQLLKVQGDRGGREIIEENMAGVNQVEIDQANLGMDLDSKSDLKRYRKFKEGK